MNRRRLISFIMASILLLLSFYPMFLIIRELVIDTMIESRYEVDHAYVDNQGFASIVDVPEIVINDQKIEIIEEETNETAPLTMWDKDERVPPGDIVNVHFELDNKVISEPSPIWLSNRHRGSRYFSWIDIVTVKDRIKNQTDIKIIQRLTDDNKLDDDRTWKIITIAEDGAIEEEELIYKHRSKNKLGVKLINLSGTALISIGYYSDVLMGYPSLIFPVLYPFFTMIIGIILFVIGILTKGTKK